MRAKEVWILGLILLASFAYAAPNPEIELTPVELYETNQAQFNLTIDNLFKDEIINTISLFASSLKINDITEFYGWENNHSENNILWYDGDIETNSIALFQFNAEAGLVNTNQTNQIEIITNNETTNTIDFIIIDDNTGPILSDPIPEDNGFLRQGINNQTISVNATDPETGILNGTFSYWDCSANATNVSTYTVELNCNGNKCQTTANLSYYKEGDRMCFEYIVYNNALESSILDGSVGFDGTPPKVKLISPEDSAIVNGAVPFIFNATDNLAPELECNLLFENNIEDSITANNGEQTSLSFDVSNLTEGTHEWKIICTDQVNLEGESPSREVITGSAPEISLNISYVERTKDYDFTVLITDETNVEKAYAIFNNNIISLSKEGDEYTGTLKTDLNNSLGNQTLSIYAEDLFGFNNTENFAFILTQGYNINLNLDPSLAKPKEQINASGTVELDDGNEVPEENITLYLPNKTVDIEINNKSFEYIFNLSEDGVYEITAEIISQEGLEHSASADLEIKSSSKDKKSGSGSSSSSSSSGGGGDIYCGDGICTGAVNENCDNCPEDCGECIPESKSDQESYTLGERQNKTQESKTRTPSGVGYATGMFSKVISNPISWIIFLAMLLLIYIIGFRPPKKSNLDWNNYFNK